MKVFVSMILCLVLPALTFGQTVDLSNVNLADLDLRQADLSKASVHFSGPMDLLVTDVYYMGAPYAALLKYDGNGSIKIAAPLSTSNAGKPIALDFSEMRLTLAADGIQVSNIIADGYYASGKLVLTRDPNGVPGLAISPPVKIGGPAVVVEMDDSAALQKQIRSLQQDLSSAQTAKADAERKSAEANTRITALENQVRTAAAGKPAAAQPAASSSAAPVPLTAQDIIRAVSNPVKSGWAGGASARGSWSSAGETLKQTGANERFAKYIVPVQQNANELVYSFRGTGSTSAWSGYGLHILGSGSKQGRGYGYGSSYLVWVTRDPLNTQSDKTFVQLYRSYDDVRMVQLASKAITESIASDLDITVYVNRGAGLVGIGVGSTPVIEFYDPAVIRSGTQLAARALGPASVSNLKIMSR